MEKGGQVLLFTGDADKNYANFSFYDNEAPYKEIVFTLTEYTRVKGKTWNDWKKEIPAADIMDDDY